MATVKLKRYFYLVHRWFGLVMCLFFSMWFVSGVVMMYVAFPSLKQQERLAGLPNLIASSVLFDPHTLIRSVGEHNVRSLRLTTILARPAYLLQTMEGDFHTVFADTGESLPEITSERALLAAQSFYFNAQPEQASMLGPQPSVVKSNIDIDQWSVSSSLNPHRPLHKVELNDMEKTHLYVSTVSGQVVRDTTRHERLWNWLGANIHWIYPVQLRQHSAIWHWAVVILSSLGMIAVLTGGTVGLLRVRVYKRYRGTDITPYRGVSKYHHILGLMFFVFLLTYITSGLLSMNPFEVFSSSESCQISERLYAGDLPKNSSVFRRDNLSSLIQRNDNLKEIRFYWVGGAVYPIGINQNTRGLLKRDGDPINELAEYAVSIACAMQCRSCNFARNLA